MIAFGQAAANFRRIKDQAKQPENIDALTVLETQTNLGAVSSKNAQDAGEKAVKVPPPEITITIGADGEPMIQAKNLPMTSQVQQVRDEQAKPFANFAETLKGTLDQSSRLAQGAPDPENVGDDPAALAHELGVDKPGFGEGGLLPWAAKADKYDRLLKDLPRLKQLVASRRLKDKMDLLGQGAEAYRAVKGIQGDERAEETQERQEKAFVFRVLGDNDFKLSRVSKSPDEAVNYMKAMAGEAWDDSYAPFVQARYADELIADAEKKSDVLRKEREDKRKDERLEKYLAGGGRQRRIPRSKSYLDRLSPESLASFVDDPDVDQDSAWEAVDIAIEQWEQEGIKNSSEYDQNLAKINAGVAGGMKKADVEALKERNKYLQGRNRYLIQKRDTLRSRVDSQRPAEGTLTAPTTPALGGAPKKKDSLGIR